MLLIATLPLIKEQRLWRKMYFTAKSVKLIRALTTRPNIRYTIINIDKEPVQSLTIAAIN